MRGNYSFVENISFIFKRYLQRSLHTISYYIELTVFTYYSRQMSSNCIFCKIITNKAPAEKLYEDDDLIIFKDIKPVSKLHILSVPKQHIPNVNSLTVEDKPLIEKLILQGKRIVEGNGGDLGDILLGFHKPPFNSVSHLHLHIIWPKTQMSYINNITYKPNTWWFITVEDLLSKL